MHDFHGLREWVRVGRYDVSASALTDTFVLDDGVLEPGYVRSVRVLAAYANYADAPLSYRLAQWMLYDADGFAYEAELRGQFYAQDALRRLKEGVILTGQSVQGWVAFEVPERAQLAYLQFRPGSLSAHVACFRLDDASPS